MTTWSTGILPAQLERGHPVRTKSLQCEEGRNVAHAEKGVALFIALMMSTIMFLIAAAILVLTMTEIHLAEYEQRSTQAFYIAESAVSHGISLLRTHADRRADRNDTLQLATNPAVGMTVEYYSGRQEEGMGHYRTALAPSVYQLIVRGIGTVPGSQAPAKRIVEQDVTIKPFALFADHSLTLNDTCDIQGHIHANQTVTISSGSAIEGHVTASGSVTDERTPLEEDDDTLPIISSQEPPLMFPNLSASDYLQAYRYNGNLCYAEPLAHDRIPLDEEKDPPADYVDLYSGFASLSETNPAGIFYPPESGLTGELVAIQVEGTLILPHTGQTSLKGLLTITPAEHFDHFPALVSAGHLTMTLVGNLDYFSGTLQPTLMHGLVYSRKHLTFIADGAAVEAVHGSVFARKITLSSLNGGEFQLKYDPALFVTPPPGVTLLETGEWGETLDPENF